MSMFGIMQGRLSDKVGMPLQSFPIQEWRIEFTRASELGFDNIEWLVDGVNDEFNPIFSSSGRQEIKGVISNSGVCVESICVHSLITGEILETSSIGSKAISNLKQLINFSNEIGIKRVIIPSMDNLSLSNESAASKMSSLLALLTKDTDIIFLLETDLSHKRIIKFINSLEVDNVGVLFDLGNANALRLDFPDEIRALAHLIGEIHIKDRRKSDGKSMRLGEAGTPFDLIRNELNQSNWYGPFVMETPIFDNWFDESIHNLKFARSFFESSF